MLYYFYNAGGKIMLNVFVKKSAEELKVGEWFSIDREAINKSKEEIRRKCNEAGDEGILEEI